MCFFLFISLFGCHVKSKKYWQRESKKVELCRNNWVYNDLTKEQEFNVLLYSPKSRYCLTFFPNFLIGVTKTKDTIAFLDKDFEGEIKIGDTIKLIPCAWSIMEKQNIKPIFFLSPNSKENNLFCKVKTVFYGKIELMKNER